MTRNPNKRRCAVPGCRAWAMRGSYLCAAHAGRTSGSPIGRGGAKGTSPSAKRKPHGDRTIDQEIDLLIARRDQLDAWLQAQIESGAEIDLLPYVRLLGQLGSRIARMMKMRAEMAGGQGDDWDEALAEALDALGDEVGLEL